MQKKCNPRNGSRPKRKKKCNKNAQKMQKFCDHCRNHKNLKNWQFPGAFAFICIFFLHFFCVFFAFFCVLAGLCFQGCIFFAFWPAVASRIAFFLHFGRSQDLGVPFFCILPGLGRLSPQKCKNNATLNSDRVANAKKKRKQQMQKKCNTQKNENSKCKKKCKQQMQNTGVDNNLGVPCCSLQRFL